LHDNEFIIAVNILNLWIYSASIRVESLRNILKGKCENFKYGKNENCEARL